MNTPRCCQMNMIAVDSERYVCLKCKRVVDPKSEAEGFFRQVFNDQFFDDLRRKKEARKG